MPSLSFVPAGETRALLLPLSPATSLLVAIQRAGAYIRHDCGGRARCGTCRLEVEGGGLSPMGEEERLRLEALGIETDGRVRLACRTHASRDLSARGCLEREAAL